MVHTPSRLAEIFVLLDKYGFSPNKLQLVMPKKGKDCNHVLIEARKNKNKNPNLKILEPLYIYKDNNEWTTDVLKIYNYGMKNE